jgi:hypothetical protein
MNLFKKNPKKFFEFISATILVVLAYYLVVYFVGIQVETTPIQKPVTPLLVEKGEEQFVNFEEFGVVHIEVDSPSYAKSNFDVNPQTPVTIYFNEPVDLQDVRNKFSLVDKVTGEEVLTEISSELRDTSDNADSYAWKWQEVWKQKVVFKPVVELRPVTMYMVEVGSGYYNKPKSGTARSGFRFEFLTADEPGVLSTNLDNRKYKIESKEAVKVIFKSPMDQEELSTKVIISPHIELKLRVNDKIMTITADLESSDYQLTIPAEVVDIYGRSLGEAFIVDFSVI